MATYQLDWLNAQVQHDPAALIAQGEAQYLAQIDYTAAQLAAARRQKPIALLCGPSSSGKTTTADRLRRALVKRGLRVETISMDDYYLSRGAYDMPWDEENGVYDFESPACMDLPLLHDHLEKLTRGQEIQIPTFDFAKKERTDQTRSMVLQEGEFVVIEGIHAFNKTLMCGLERHATGIYISVASRLEAKDWTMEPEQLRFCRRAVRDANFRGAPVESTIEQWLSVRRGERLYIDPYRAFASYTIDSYLPYETCILMDVLRGQLREHREELARIGLDVVCQAAEEIASLDYEPYMPETSVLHEFVG